MDQIIVLVLVGALALGKWLFENAGKFQSGESDDSAPDRSQRNTGVPRNPRPIAGAAPRWENEEEKMRRFMEALGLPPQEGVPPPVRKPKRIGQPAPVVKAQPQSQPQPRPQSVRPQISRPLETGGPLPTLPKTASVGETAPSMEVTSIPQMTFASPEQAMQSTAAEISAAAKLAGRPSPQKRQMPAVQAALREQLRDPASLRKAILLREILGVPKGLQSAQTPSIFSPL